MCSSLYRELSQEEIFKLVSSALKTEVISYKLLTGGLFNTTYLVETSARGRVVLRAGPVNRHLLMPFEHRLMEAEEQVYALCAAYGIPTSEIMAIDTSKTLIDRDFMFVRYIPSRAMSEIQLTPPDNRRICRAVGAASASMHAIHAPRFGRVAEVKSGGGYSLWSDCLVHELLDWESVGRPASLFTEAEHTEIRRLFERASPYLDDIQEPSLVHTDLWHGNILIRTDTERPEFAAIIDADRALWGDPLFEFSSIRWTYSEEAFWEGYGRPLPKDRPSRIRCALYTLLNRLWNAYVYAKEYNQPDNAEEERTDAYKQMTQLQELL